MKNWLLAGTLLLFTGMLPAQDVKVSSGSLRRFSDFPSRFVSPRNVDVWLPPGYDPGKKYAVLYMNDGQMLWDSSTTWNKQEWCVDETAGRLIMEKKVRPFIVVGIWNGGKLRHCEYMPQKAFERLSRAEQDSMYEEARNTGYPVFNGKVLSDNYLRFIVEELKPFIDSVFPTHKGRSSTFIMGSSMGGLISLYALCEYPEVFGGAGCLSTHWPGIFRSENNPIPGALLAYLAEKLPSPKGHRIYFDYGDKTLDALYKPFQLRADAVMKARGYGAKNWMSAEFKGDDHSERSWSKRLSVPLEFLLRR